MFKQLTHVTLFIFPEARQRYLMTLTAHTLVEQVVWGLTGINYFGGHLCFIACWQVVQNGTRVPDGTQPQVHVDFCLYRPTSRPFSRKLEKGYKEDHLVSRSQLGTSLVEKRGPGPGGDQGSREQFSGGSPYPIMRIMTPIATIHNSGTRPRSSGA